MGIVFGFLAIAGAIALGAAVVGRVNAQDWRTASQEAVGLAPDPATHAEAVVQVYAARVIGWRGVFGVHTWIAAKPAAASQYTVYEIIGWRLRWQDSALAVRHRAPDARWFGSVPERVAEKRGPAAAGLIPRVDARARLPWAGEYTMWRGRTRTPSPRGCCARFGVRPTPPTAIGKTTAEEAAESAPSGKGVRSRSSACGVPASGVGDSSESAGPHSGSIPSTLR